MKRNFLLMLLLTLLPFAGWSQGFNPAQDPHVKVDVTEGTGTEAVTYQVSIATKLVQLSTSGSVSAPVIYQVAKKTTGDPEVLEKSENTLVFDAARKPVTGGITEAGWYYSMVTFTVGTVQKAIYVPFYVAGPVGATRVNSKSTFDNNMADEHGAYQLYYGEYPWCDVWYVGNYDTTPVIPATILYPGDDLNPDGTVDINGRWAFDAETRSYPGHNSNDLNNWANGLLAYNNDEETIITRDWEATKTENSDNFVFSLFDDDAQSDDCWKIYVTYGTYKGYPWGETKKFGPAWKNYGLISVAELKELGEVPGEFVATELKMSLVPFTFGDEDYDPAGIVENTKDLSDFTVTVEEESYEYDGNEHIPAITVTDPDNATSALVKDRDYTINWGTTQNFRTAGKKTFTVNGIGSYKGTKEGFYTIVGKHINVNIAQCTKVYGSPDPKYAKVEIDASSSSMAAGEDFDQIREAFLFERESDEGAAGENVGPHKYVVHVDPTYVMNYDVSVLQNYGYLYIDKADLEITVKPASKDFGQADPTFSIDAVSTEKPLVNGDTKENLAITITRDKAGTAAGEAVGEYPFTATTANYNVRVTNAFTINASEVTNDGLAITSPVTYSGSTTGQQPAHSVQDKNNKALTEGTEAQVAAGEADYWSTWEDNTNAGEATWTAHFSESFGGGSKSKTFVINKKEMHVKAAMKPGTYNTGYEFDEDDVMILFDAADFVGRDVEPKEAIFASDNGYIAPKVEKQGNGPSEYDLVIVPDDPTADPLVYGNSANYTFVPASENGKLILGRAQLYVQANGTKVYGDTKEEVYTFQISTDPTFEENVWEENATSTFIHNYSITASRAEGENAGNYTITSTGPSVVGPAGTGYAVNYINGVFAITKAPLTIWAKGAEKFVDEADPSPWPIEVDNENGLVNGDQLEDIITTTWYYGRNRLTGNNTWTTTRPAIVVDTEEYNNFTVTRQQGEVVTDNGYEVTGIEPAPSFNYNETLQNYDVTCKVLLGAKLIIKPIGVTVNVVNAEITYGETYTPAITISRDQLDRDRRRAILEAIRTSKIIVNNEEVDALQYNVPEELTVTGSPYTITVKETAPTRVLGKYNITYQSGTLTVNPFVLTIKANDQGIAYTETYCPWDVTFNGVDAKTLEGYETGDCVIEATGDKLNEVFRLDLKDTYKRVGATANAYVLTPSNGKSANYTLNELVDDVTNGWLSIDPLETIPLENAELAALLGKDADEAGTNPSLLQKVLEEHRGIQVNVKMPARRMKADDWYTWVLPFEITLGELFAAETGWGYGALEILDAAKSKGDKIVFALQMKPVKANTPFIVKVENEITAEEMNDKIFYGVVIENKDYLFTENPVPATGNDGNVKFVGLYYDKKGFTAKEKYNASVSGAPRGFYPGGDNSGNIVVKRTNAYLLYPSEEAQQNSRIYIQEPDGSYTAINGIDGDTNDSNAEGIYNLSGQRVNKAQKGIYIQNGKKVLVK
jgi:hypothetical protein